MMTVMNVRQQPTRPCMSRALTPKLRGTLERGRLAIHSMLLRAQYTSAKYVRFRTQGINVPGAVHSWNGVPVGTRMLQKSQ